MVSPASKWFSLRMRDPRLQGISLVDKWVEQCSSITYFHYQISNFQPEFNEAMLDFGGFGTFSLCQEELPLVRGMFKGLVFKSLDISEYLFSENQIGMADTLFRDFKFTVRQAAQKWGLENLPADMQKKHKEDPYYEYKFCQAVYPRMEMDEKNEIMPFASVYFCAEPAGIIAEGGYHEFPYAIGRWEKTSGEIWGRGPGVKALADIRTINLARKYGFKAWSLDMLPPLQVPDDGVIGSIRTVPAGITYVREGAEIKPLYSARNYNGSQFEESKLKASIKECFYADQLQLPPMQGTPATATEIMQRIEQMHRLLGPPAGRLENEGLSPCVTRSFNTLYRAKQFPPIPQIILDILGDQPIELDIEYLGPLARAQKATDVFAIQRWLESISGLIQIKPQTADIINGDAIAKINRERLGAPADVEMNDDDVSAMREERAKAVAEANRTAQMTQQADMVGKMAPLARGAVGNGR